jgi:ADP-ribose pyrophosphatase YjhB (NUDIX family)
VEEKRKIIYCADAVARYEGPEGPLVAVRRVKEGGKIAWPGGKQESSEAITETLTETIIREYREETGLELEILGVLCMQAEDDRDPRGRFVSVVFYGIARGTAKDEPGKTEVVMLEPEEATTLKSEFAFDHGDVLDTYRAVVK